MSEAYQRLLDIAARADVEVFVKLMKALGFK
jgi:hypothetical protein